MKLFSQRNGFKPIKDTIQIESIDTDLRNRLWDGLQLYYWDKVHKRFISDINQNDSEYKVIILLKRIWHGYYKQPIDTINNAWSATYSVIRQNFFEYEFFEVYDFIEFIANSYKNGINDNTNIKFMEFCNTILEQELSAFRFVGGNISQITNEEEISAIEEALKIEDALNPIKIHLKRSLDLLTDRNSPDFRNSIKESISAVEAICKIITGNNKATLGDALSAIEIGNKVKMHPALSGSFKKLYGYTSATDGIRHALLDESDLQFEDAKFMLVSCSGFINYLIVKSSNAGIKL